MPASARRTEKLSLRLARGALHAATAMTHCPLGELVFKGALERAGEVLTDRRAFLLGAVQGKAFLAALNAPARPLPCLARLLREPGYFAAEG